MGPSFDKLQAVGKLPHHLKVKKHLTLTQSENFPFISLSMPMTTDNSRCHREKR